MIIALGLKALSRKVIWDNVEYRKEYDLIIIAINPFKFILAITSMLQINKYVFIV